MCSFGVNPHFLNFSSTFFIPYFLVEWLGYCLHNSGRKPVSSMHLFPLSDFTGNFPVSSLFLFQLGKISRGVFHFLFSPALVDISVTFAAASATGRCFYWSRCPLAAISDYGRYFVISLAVSTSHVAKDPSLITWVRFFFVRHQMILLWNMAKSYWDVGQYAPECSGCWNHFLLVLCDIILDCWLP